MRDISTEKTVTSGDQWQDAGRAYCLLLAAAAFALFWLSSFALEARNGARHFGADGHLYEPIARGYLYDRVSRYHPVTVVMALVWLKALSFLNPWITPSHLLNAMFAMVGAVGVYAAMAAFSSVVSRRHAGLWAMIYALSFGIWYFSSIPELKIVTATLSALYIACYLRLRERWTISGSVLLTAVLLIACLNEIVSCFLVVVPIVDTLAQRGWGLRHGRWIVMHCLAAPIALIVLEGAINDRLIAAGPDPEGRSHFRMMIFYLLRNDYSASGVYAFLLNWFLFNIAAPTPFARYGSPTTFGGSFEPTLSSYLISPVSASAMLLLAAMIGGSAVRSHRKAGSAASTAILLALLAYVLVRGMFFLIFNPAEPLLFSPAITLAYLLAIAMPFAVSNVPAKPIFLASLVALLFVANGAFMFGQEWIARSAPVGPASPP